MYNGGLARYAHVPGSSGLSVFVCTVGVSTGLNYRFQCSVSYRTDLLVMRLPPFEGGGILCLCS